MKRLFKLFNYFKKPYISNVIAFLALLIASFTFVYSIIPKHRFSYLIKTTVDYANLDEESKIGQFLNSSNYILFFNTGNKTESVTDVDFYLIKNDSSIVLQRNNWFDEPFILEGGKTKVFILRNPIISLNNIITKRDDVLDLQTKKEDGYFKIEVTYIGKNGLIKTHQYTKNLKEIFNNLSFTTKEVRIE